MPISARTEESIFAEALDKRSTEELAAFLDGACGSDAALRARVENLLKSHEHAGSFLRKPPAATVDEPVAERPGTVIGPYKLMEQIGEGGMGLVFVAEQQQPVRRRVALKIIKPGMDSRQVIARFEAERQALALMDHQNIAKVYDAGTTGEPGGVSPGRPYFVMELVHGVPITDYCDANQLTPRQRLELFVPVCQAIQHAHQKGIIHRDIKPSNVLVTMYDDKPVPKVIDFGVAKAIEQRLTETSVYTQFGTLVGTFEYMSPEQAEMNAFGVDTRSDIYALGVLLYELMTGSTPLERKRLREAAFDEIRRIIKEEEPQRPSVRLSTSDTLAKVAEARKTDPAKLSRLMRGELDWVVMKCLEKDRSRRYDTASALARDVERHLKDEPVEARPPSTWYRLRKAARRNRTALSVAGVVGVTVLLGTTVAVLQGKRASDEEARRIQEKTNHDAEVAELKRIQDEERRQEKLDRAIEAAFSGDLERADKAIVEAEKAGVAADRVRWLRGLVHYQQGKLEDAIREFKASIDLKPSVAAYAMHARALFQASLQSGNSLTRYYQEARIDLVHSTPPETAEDYLCRGFTLGTFIITHHLDIKRTQPLADIDKAIAMRDTPIARAFRIIVDVGPNDEGDWRPSLERALEGWRRANVRLWDNKFVRHESLGLHIWAATRYEAIGQPEKRKTFWEEAERDAKELEGIRNYNYVMARVYYFELIRNTDAALKELEEASRHPETSDLVANYALALYERGRDAEALSVLNAGLKLKPNNSAGQMLRFLLWADQPEIGRDKAFERWREKRGPLKGAKGPSWNPYDHVVLLLLGKSKEVAEQSASVSVLRPSATYLIESQSEAKWLEAEAKFLEPLKDPLWLCFAHFMIGEVRLSKGDRAGAREHFQKAVDTKFYANNLHPYARAFVARMDRNPKWPVWIPVKK